MIHKEAILLTLEDYQHLNAIYNDGGTCLCLFEAEDLHEARHEAVPGVEVWYLTFIIIALRSGALLALQAPGKRKQTGSVQE